MKKLLSKIVGEVSFKISSEFLSVDFISYKEFIDVFFIYLDFRLN